jgi:hypothetical protein
MKGMKLVLGTLLLLYLFSAIVFSNDVWTRATEIYINTVRSGSVSGEDRIDWWKIYIPGPGAVVIFLEVPDGDRYRLDFKMFSSDWTLLGQDRRLTKFKPLFGTVRGGLYYLKVYASYVSSRRVYYKIGVAYSDEFRYLKGKHDTDWYNARIVGGTITWLFVVDISSPDEVFDPDIYVYYQDERVGESTDSQNLDYIRWQIDYTREFKIKVTSYRGSGRYWIMMLTYHLPS